VLLRLWQDNTERITKVPAMLNRAYSLLEIKQVDDDARIITGMASTPTPDRL